MALIIPTQYFLNRMELDYYEKEFIDMCGIIYNKNKHKYEI